MIRIALVFLLVLSLRAETSQDFDLASLKNPFSNPILEQIYNLKIQAIMLDKVKINDKWYQKNESINKALIQEISPAKLSLKYKNETIIIKVVNDKISIN